MNDFKDKIRKVASTIAIVCCMLRLIEIEENQLAKILEILITIYRILNTLEGLITKGNSSNIDDNNI